MTSSICFQILMIVSFVSKSIGDVLFYYKMDDAISNHTEWTTIGGTDTLTTGPDPNCPLSTDYCWKGSGEFIITRDAFNTTDYENITMQWSASGNTVSQAACGIQYSTDGGSTWLYTQYFSDHTDSFNTSGAFSSWLPSPDGNSNGIRIQLRGMNLENTAPQNCYFNEFSLTGSIIHRTPSPTSNPTPITLQPTLAPIASPSFPPSIAPTFMPTSASTFTPTISPTYFPFAKSISPTNSPSNVPTEPPSNAPSLSPYTAPSLSPTTIPGYCMWGEHYSLINGLYRFQGYYNEHMYYMKKEYHPSCQSWTLYLFYAGEATINPWTIALELGTLESAKILMYCTSDAPTPKECDGLWNGWDGAHTRVFATEGSCPSWHCDEIVIPSIAKLPWYQNSCGVTFNTAIAPNVWTNEPRRSRYWWFHRVLFIWLCTDYEPVQTCNITTLKWYAATTISEPWHELSNKQSVSMEFDYPDTNPHVMYCNGPTSNPTESPSFEPTEPSSSPTKQPSSEPTRTPTVARSYNSYVDVLYGLQGLSDLNLHLISNNAVEVMRKLEGIISTGYINTLPHTDNYETFKVMILKVDEYDISEVVNVTLSKWNDFLRLSAQIECDTHFCDDILNVYNATTFTEFVTRKLAFYFGDSNEALQFVVISISDVMSLADAQFNFDLIYIAVGSIFVIMVVPSSLLSWIAYFVYHRKRPGTDPPRYRSLFICVGNVADLYTNVWWSLMLMTQRHTLWLPAVLITFVPHILSIGIGVWYIFKWKQKSVHSIERAYISKYTTKYYKPLILCIVITGFYPTLEMICSHLCHLNALSFDLYTKDKLQIANIKMINALILNQIPIFIIQYLYLMDTNTNVLSATLITISFTIICMLWSVCTVLSRVRNDLRRRMLGANMADVLLEFEVKQNTPNIIQSYHIHSHWLLTSSLSFALNIKQYQIDVGGVQKINDGIRVNARLKWLQPRYAQMVINKLKNENSLLYKNVAVQCCYHLEIELENVHVNMLEVLLCAAKTTSISRSSMVHVSTVFGTKKRESKRNTDLIRQNVENELRRIRIEHDVKAMIKSISPAAIVSKGSQSEHVADPTFAE
eukprot:271608_1